MRRTSEISRSFNDLRALADSFSPVPSRMGQRKRILVLSGRLGPVAVPLLCRQLLRGDATQASWAYFLLLHGGSERALRALRAASTDAALPDARRALALSLLGELGAPLPASVRLLDDREPGRGTLVDLTRGLAAPADAALAADELLARSEGRDLVLQCRSLIGLAGASAAPILEELLARDDVGPAHKRTIATLRAGIGRAPTLCARASRVVLGTGAAGTVVIAFGRSARGRRRVLVVQLAPDGTLARVLHDDTGAAGFAPRALRERLMGEGFTLRRSTVGAVAARIALAARAACISGARLPRAYHLGRDLVGLFDEHAAPAPPNDPEALFDRGRALLDAGDAVHARPLLQAYASVRPEDAEGRTWLGSCLLALAETEAALAHLVAAVRLEPEDAVRRWNLAVAAKGAGRSGMAYLALNVYLALTRKKGRPRRRRLARRFIRTYDRLIAAEHPGVPARLVAAAEDGFLCACDHLENGRALDAVRGFEAVLARLPSHHPSWGNLGAAHLLLGQRAEARRCLETALVYRPDYELARKNLAKVDVDMTTAP